MTTRQWSNALTAVTVALSILAYALADRYGELALVAVPLALLGWYVADIRGFALTRRPVSDILVIAAIAWSAYRVRTLGWVEGLTVSVFCEFLASIILVKMWDRKQPRDTAQILTLSVFLSVGSMLTGTSFALAALLVINLGSLLLAVSLFHLAGDPEPVLAGGSPRPASAGPGVRAHFGATIAGCFVLGLGLSIAVFLIMPRGIGTGFAGRVGQPTGGRQTGLSDHVDLRQAGLISESARTVLRAEFTDLSGRPLGTEGRVFYLRASALDVYDGRAWTSSLDVRPSTEAQREMRVSFGGKPGPGGIVQRVWMLDAPREGPVPHVYRAVEAWADAFSIFRFGRETATLTRSGESGRLGYTVTSGPPTLPPVQRFERSRTATFEVAGVRRIAENVVRSAGYEPDPALRPRGSDLDACAVIERYLRSGFAYTLDAAASPPGRDPIEWFLTDRRAGHCEYFASAMAGMCRGIGVNARVVTGYAAGEFDAQTGQYIVRESNAHAWVEAEIDDGLWWTFDPTPPDTLQARLRPPTGLAAVWASWLDRVNASWSTSIVSFDETSRRRLLGFSADPEPWLRARLARLRERFDEEGWRGTVPILVKAALVIVIASAAAVFSLRASRRALDRLLARIRQRSRIRDDPELARAMGNTEFFARTIALLRKRGFVKPAWQPPGAFAARVAAADPALGAVAVRATDLYYRARFGRRPLGDDEIRAVQSAIDDAARFSDRSARPRPHAPPAA